MTTPGGPPSAPSSRVASGRGRPLRIAGPLVAPLFVAMLVAVAPAPGAAATTLPGSDPIVVLIDPTPVRSTPNVRAPAVTVIAASRPITAIRTVLPVLRQRQDASGRTWLQVRLPGRTLGAPVPPRRGWILARGTRAAAMPWRIAVDVDAQSVTVSYGGTAVRRFRAIVGASATPTPRGAFFVEENVRLPTGRVGAPFALATSARSDVLQEFDGGPGQIALHGLRNVGGRLGTAVSHGCVRLSNAAISWIARRVGPGARVTIE